MFHCHAIALTIDAMSFLMPTRLYQSAKTMALGVVNFGTCAITGYSVS
jgi:hypothetical protein